MGNKSPAPKQPETPAQRHPHHEETVEMESDGDDESGMSEADDDEEVKGRISFAYPRDIEPTLADAMSVFITQKEKMKIWKGQFVDMFTFLPQGRGVTTNTHVIMNDRGTLVTQHEHKEISSIEEWTSAFLNFVLAYCEGHGDRYRELMIYMKIIRFAADHFVGYGWRTYDVMFRLAIVSDPERTWGQVDQNLWALYVTSPTMVKTTGVSYKGTAQNLGMRVKKGHFRPSQRTGTPQRTPPRTHGAPRPRTCRYFNEGSCTFGSTCKFPHKCAKCGANHPATGCK